MWKKSTWKKVRITLLVIMVMTIALYAVNRWMVFGRFDRSVPEIAFDQDILEVSVTASEEELLKGVTASDKKDGDVTDTIIIESISNLLSDNQRIVTYAAFDGDNHVGKAERRIQYTDYTEPRFHLSGPLRAESASTEISEVLKNLYATDCIDGDLTDEIVVVNTSILSMTAEALKGEYQVQVTNSCGDVASLKLPVTISFQGSSQHGGFAQLDLSDYLIYCTVGEQIDPASYVTAVMVNGMEYSASDVQISSGVDASMPGVYTVNYTIEADGAKATADLIVVVEDTPEPEE